MNSTARSPRRDYIVAREVALLFFVGAFLGVACYALIASFMPAAASFAAIGLLLPYGLLILFRIAYRRRTGRGFVQVWAEFAEHREKQEKVRQEAAIAGRLAKMKADPMAAAPSTISISLLNWAALGLFLYSGALIGSQALYWLKTGHWLPISIGTVFMEQFEDSPWPLGLLPELANEGAMRYILQVSPAELIGLQKLISWLAINVPLSFATLIASGLASAKATALSQARARCAREARLQ